MRILVVDDSIAYRKTISQILSECEGIEVVGEAANGKIATARLQQESVDLVTLDMEMPEMDGLATLKEISANSPHVRVIVFASQTARGATGALKALELGAVDVVPKPNRDYDSIREAYEHVKELLLPRVLAFQQEAANGPAVSRPSPIPNQAREPARSVVEEAPVAFHRHDLRRFRPKLIVIGSSTGGPAALTQLFSEIGISDLSVPILIAQHMPPVFTKSLADRIGKESGIACAEAVNGEPLLNRIYVAPGDFHLEITPGHDEGFQLRVHQGPKRHNVRPTVDILFESAAEYFGKRTMAFVLTGMGSDGGQGAVCIKKSGGAVMIQDKQSSVVWGMPGAVHEHGAFDAMGDIHRCQNYLREMAQPMSGE